jgi:hypothetical protein
LQEISHSHLAGAALSQSISMFLYLSDPNPGFACWTMIISIWLFWTLPFVYKWTGNLQAAAMVTVELLAFASLFGAFFYGGVSSPFLPWLIVRLLLGFFYLAKSPSLVVAMFTFNILAFCAAHFVWGFPDLVRRKISRPLAGFRFCQRRSTCPGWPANMMSMSSRLSAKPKPSRNALRLQQAKDAADAANRTRQSSWPR